MKKIISILLLSGSIFADLTSVERPSLDLGKDQSLEILGNIEYQLKELNNQFAINRALFLELQRANDSLSSSSDGLIYLLAEARKTNEQLEHMLWNQDHRMTEARPNKKGP